MTNARHAMSNADPYCWSCAGNDAAWPGPIDRQRKCRAGMCRGCRLRLQSRPDPCRCHPRLTVYGSGEATNNDCAPIKSP